MPANRLGDQAVQAIPRADVAVTDQLELEIRQLDGVCFVAFGERSGATLILVGVEPGFDDDAVRAEVVRFAASQVDGEVVVELAGDLEVAATGPDVRVRLLVALAVPERRMVEVHLAHRGRRIAVEAASDQRLDVAVAVVAALAELGFAVPYEPVGAHALDDDLGSGTLVVLADPSTGDVRRGLASGRSDADSTARAVLSALNRFLQPSLPERT